MATIRGYRPDDLPALYDICLTTGASGQDATTLYSDPDLVGQLYAAPYGVLEPERVLVAEDELGVAGYIVGTFDSDGFAARQERDWWPALRQRYSHDSAAFTAADRQRIAEAVAAIGNAALALGPELVSLEVNPLRVHGKDCEALDALAVWNA